MAKSWSLGIVGTGLIGASIAEAAVAAGALRELLLLDRDPSHADQVAERHAIAGRVDHIEALAACDIVFVCTPVNAIAPAVLALAGGPVVIDVGSIKQPVLEAVAAGGGNPRFVPGHPLSGGTASGPAQARAGLLAERPFVLCPYDGIDPAALAFARAFLARLGAKTIEIDAAAHDRLLALTSHVPHLIAFALVGAYAALPEAERAAAAALMPNSFDAITHFAASDPVMWADIFAGSPDAVGASWAAVRQAAERIVATERSDLIAELDRLRAARLRLAQGGEA